MKNQLIRGCVLTVLAVAAGGCSGHQELMQESARSAAVQLAALEAELQAKIRVENEYQQGQLSALTDGLNRTRVTDFNVLLANKAKAFAATEKDGLKPQSLTDFLDKQGTGFLVVWAASEAEREAKIEAVADQLAAGRVDLETKRVKIGELMQKLRTLSEAPSRKQMASFMMGFVDASLQEMETGDGGGG